MKKTLTMFAALIALAPAAAFADEAADKAAIGSQIEALGKAYMAGDAAAIRGLMTADQRSVTYEYHGAFKVDQQIEALKDLKVEAYDAIPPAISFLGPDAALVTYEQSYRGTYKDDPLPGRVYISEIWVRDGGKWLQKFYQETIMELE